MADSGMIHLNDNILCAIDIRISGANPNEHEIVQIAIMPLDSHLSPNKSILPFYCDISPANKSAYDRSAYNMYTPGVSRDEFDRLCTEGIPRWNSVELFDEWYERLNLKSDKRIMPLAYNWITAYPFIKKWIGGFKNMTYYISDFYRDLINTAQFLNDYYDFHIERCPYPKIDFQYICRQNKLGREKPTDALLDCLYISQNYQLMLRDSFLKFPFIPQNEREL